MLRICAFFFVTETYNKYDIGSEEQSNKVTVVPKVFSEKPKSYLVVIIVI